MNNNRGKLKLEEAKRESEEALKFKKFKWTQVKTFKNPIKITSLSRKNGTRWRTIQKEI